MCVTPKKKRKKIVDKKVYVVCVCVCKSLLSAPQVAKTGKWVNKPREENKNQKTKTNRNRGSARGIGRTFHSFPYHQNSRQQKP